MNKKAIYAIVAVIVVAVAYYLYTQQAPAEEAQTINNTVTTEVRVIDPNEQ